MASDLYVHPDYPHAREATTARARVQLEAAGWKRYEPEPVAQTTAAESNSTSKPRRKPSETNESSSDSSE